MCICANKNECGPEPKPDIEDATEIHIKYDGYISIPYIHIIKN